MKDSIFFITLISILSIGIISLLLWIFIKSLKQNVQNAFNEFHIKSINQDGQLKDSLHQSITSFTKELEKRFQEQGNLQDDRQLKALKLLQDSLNSGIDNLSKSVDKRLNEGFDKTTQTFTDIVKRLALIDDAQKKLSDLSNNVVSLQEILLDKRSRGAFGEIQLQSLIENIMPPNSYSFQESLSNGKRVDCLLYLPKPTGNLAIDSKFPLENYQKLVDFNIEQSNKKSIEAAFRQDIKTHINDIATKYIIANETSVGAIMFIPAEAIFSKIHEYPELIALAQQKNVWIASPTTMMAILTTAQAVLKDDATKKHVHLIQEHLKDLALDFSRFEERMTKLARHIDLANDDVKQVQVSAKKITRRFSQIDNVENLSPMLEEQE